MGCGCNKTNSKQLRQPKMPSKSPKKPPVIVKSKPSKIRLRPPK